MKAVRSSSHVSVVPSLSSSNHVFASPVVSFNCKFICGFRNGDCREGSQSDNTVGSPHEFIIHGIEIFKGNEKVTEVTDVENCQIDNSRTLRKRLGRFRTFQGKGIVCEMRGDGIDDGAIETSFRNHMRDERQTRIEIEHQLA
ncbi:hypothetical protein Tco_1261985 [Tanacetum coccineum]